jgi:hypothetical protein
MCFNMVVRKRSALTDKSPAALITGLWGSTVVGIV